MPTVRPPRNGPIKRHRISEKNFWSYCCAPADAAKKHHTRQHHRISHQKYDPWHKPRREFTIPPDSSEPTENTLPERAEQRRLAWPRIRPSGKCRRRRPRKLFSDSGKKAWLGVRQWPRGGRPPAG